MDPRQVSIANILQRECTGEQRDLFRKFSYLEHSNPKSRELVDFVLQAIELLPVSDSFHYYYLEHYCSCFEDLKQGAGNSLECLDKDIKQTKSFAKDKNLPIVHRIRAFQNLGFVYLQKKKNSQKAMAFERQGLELAKAATPEDMAVRIRSSHLAFLPCKRRIVEDMHKTEFYIKALELGDDRVDEFENWLYSRPDVMASLDKTWAVDNAFGYISEVPSGEQSALFVAGGGQCDECGAPKPMGKTLLRCGKCTRVHYCNKECQTKHWYSTHRPICKTRKEGGFLEGDICRVAGLKSKPELNGLTVRVVGPSEAGDRYEVKPNSGKRANLLVKPENLILGIVRNRTASSAASNSTQEPCASASAA